MPSAGAAATNGAVVFLAGAVAVVGATKHGWRPEYRPVRLLLKTICAQGDGRQVRKDEVKPRRCTAAV